MLTAISLQSSARRQEIVAATPSKNMRPSLESYAGVFDPAMSSRAGVVAGNVAEIEL
jgi:hypothetical protein